MHMIFCILCNCKSFIFLKIAYIRSHSYIMSFASGQPIYLVGKCLFPRMANEYDYYILLKSIANLYPDPLSTLQQGTVIPPYFFPVRPSLKPPSSRKKNRRSTLPKQGRKPIRRRPRVAFKSLAKTVEKSAGYPTTNHRGELLLNHVLGNMLDLFQAFLSRSAVGKSLWIAVLVQGRVFFHDLQGRFVKSCQVYAFFHVGHEASETKFSEWLHF